MREARSRAPIDLPIAGTGAELPVRSAAAALAEHAQPPGPALRPRATPNPACVDDAGTAAAVDVLDADAVFVVVARGEPICRAVGRAPASSRDRLRDGNAQQSCRSQTDGHAAGRARADTARQRIEAVSVHFRASRLARVAAVEARRQDGAESPSSGVMRLRLSIQPHEQHVNIGPEPGKTEEPRIRATHRCSTRR
jgi:hypothetical protein